MSEDVKGTQDGLVTASRGRSKTQPLITVQQLKDVYLTGLNITDPNTGEELPDSTYQTYIDNAISMLEHYLDISIAPVENYIEHADYESADYYNWGILELNNFPVIKVKKIDLVFYHDDQNQPESFVTIPNSWVRLSAHDGIVRLVPSGHFPADLQVGRSGSFHPFSFRHQKIPHAWRISYDYGFENGKIPTLINTAVATMASIQALITGGNLVLGAGIANTSLSIDGLSQAIGTTQSAENSAFSATQKDYANRLFGTTKDDPAAILTILKNYYKGSGLQIF